MPLSTSPAKLSVRLLRPHSVRLARYTESQTRLNQMGRRFTQLIFPLNFAAAGDQHRDDHEKSGGDALPRFLPLSCNHARKQVL